MELISERFSVAFRGVSNNRGRAVGSVNIATKEVRAGFRLILENNLSRFQTDLDLLEPKDRLRLLVDISKLILPKPAEENSEENDNHYTVEVIEKPFDIRDF